MATTSPDQAKLTEAAAARPHRLSEGMLNLPNQITWARLALAVVLFVMIEFELWWLSLVVFVIAASTDFLDGYLARRYSMVTSLGRILDPFVDKVIVLGAFVFLLAVPAAVFAPPAGPGLAAWMVVVIVGREMFVTALRGFLEQHGADFSATLSGKLKMVLQCVAISLILFFFAAFGPDADGSGRSLALITAWACYVVLWLAVIATIASGLVYLYRAAQLLK